MIKELACVAILLGTSKGMQGAGKEPAPSAFAWNSLAPFVARPPAGTFIGIADGVLMVGDQVLEDPQGRWRIETVIPLPDPFGLAVSTPLGLVCLGGRAGRAASSAVYRLNWEKGRVRVASLPDLPQACAYPAGAAVGATVYVAGGGVPSAGTAGGRNFWALDLRKTPLGWRSLPAWPGPARLLAAGGGQDGSFFLFGGLAQSVPPSGPASLSTALRDAYRFTPEKGWRALAEAPHPIIGGGSPLAAVGQSTLLALNGAASNQALSYHTVTDTWVDLGPLPFAPSANSAVFWRGTWIAFRRSPEAGGRVAAAWAGRADQSKVALGAVNAGVIFLYLILIMGVGLGVSRRHRGTSGYFVGGHKIPWWAAGLSIFATVLSSITFMSIPAKTYVTDWLYLATNLPILLLAPLIVTCYLPFFRQLNVVSAYEYLEKRFSLAVRLFGSASYVLAQCARMAIILYLPALALATVSSINVEWCIVIAGVVAVAYTTIGGIEAAIWADVVQAIVLLGAAVLCLGVALHSGGGLAEAWRVARADHKLTLVQWSWSTSFPSTGLLFAGASFAHLISYTADQTVVQRYLTTSDEKQAAKAIWTNALLAVPVSILFFSLGTAIYLFYKAHPSQLEPVLTNDGILPYFIMQHLSVGLAGLAIAGIFACSQSSVSSSLNSVATALVTDFYRRLNPGFTDAACLKMARRLTLMVGLAVIGLALLMATFDIRSVWDLFAMFVGLIGSSLGSFFALGIFTRRANAGGALIGAAIGLATLIAIRCRTQVHFFLYPLIGVVTCFATGWIASLFLPAETRNLDRLTWYTRKAGKE